MTPRRSPKDDKRATRLAGSLLRLLVRRGQLIWLMVAVAVVAMSLISPHFLTVENLFTNVLRQSAVVGIVSVGMTLVIATRGFDLSVGSNIALSSSIMALLLTESGATVIEGIAVALAIGAAIGATNGVLVAKIRVPPFIATLGMLSIARGLALVFAGTTPVDLLPQSLLDLGRGKVGFLPLPVLFLAGTWLVAAYLVKHTRFGRYALAIGSNEEGARLSGVKVDSYRIAHYVVLGVLTAAAGVVLTGRLGAAQATMAVGLEFQAIAAVVVGGTSLFGGEAKLAGSVGGAILVGVLRNGLLLRSVDTNWINIIIGAVMVASVAFDGLRRIRAGRLS
ncbi:MAG: ABC transporter permease [Acidimicrobiales bacterium]|nr:ABC transporter permease [Acidimicrobiales bacterium]